MWPTSVRIAVEHCAKNLVASGCHVALTVTVFYLSTSQKGLSRSPPLNGDVVLSFAHLFFPFSLRLSALGAS